MARAGLRTKPGMTKLAIFSRQINGDKKFFKPDIVTIYGHSRNFGPVELSGICQMNLASVLRNS